MLFSLAVAGCGGGGSGSSSSSSDTTPPTVSSTQPADGATDVAPDAVISATFSEAMTVSSVSVSTFTLKAGGTAVGGTVDYSGTTATFTPSADLAADTVYTATIKTGVKDAAGNPLAADHTWSFTTAPDTTPPTVQSTAPANNAVDVPVNTVVTVVFSEAMDPATLTTTTFSVKGGGGPVTGTVGFSSNSATFTPSANLDSATLYTARISTGAMDLAGNPLEADYTWQFTTGGALDNIPPTVQSTVPANNAVNVPLSTVISATFSEAMDPSTITTDSFVVGTGGNPIPGTVAYSGTTASFTPSAGLASGAVYTATIRSFATDLAGNSLAAAYNWQFTVIQKPTLCVTPGGINGCYDNIADAVTDASPGDVIGVALGTYTENVVIAKTIMLQGGWNLTIDAWDPASNVTTINPSDSTKAVVTITGNPADTSAISPTIDGFTITGALSGSEGGGIRMTDSDATVRNNNITGNQSKSKGGGIWAKNGIPNIGNNQITNNTVIPASPAYGGGIELDNTQAILIENTISGNTVTGTTGNGGGVAIVGGGPVKLIGNTISGNTGSQGAGNGGGISLETATATFSGNTIQNNVAGAGSAAGNGGGIYITGSTSLTMNDNTIKGNAVGGDSGGTPSYGGGVYIGSSEGSLSGNTISNNLVAVSGTGSAKGWGGGLAIGGTDSTIFVHGGTFAGNSARSPGNGCGIYADSSAVKLNAVYIQNNTCAGLYFTTTTFTLTNSLVTGNTTGGLKAVSASPGDVINNTFGGTNSGEGINTDSALSLVNNIIMAYATGVKVGATPPVSKNNDFFNNTAHTDGFSPGGSDLVGVNPALTSDYRLAGTSSPLVLDGGTHGPIPDASVGGQIVNIPDTDIDGESRAMIGPSLLYKVDIGADEFGGNIPRPQRIINMDGGGANLTIIGPGGMPSSSTTADWIGYAVSGGDFNGDGNSDLALSAEAWDFDSPPHSTGRVFGLLNFGTRKTGVIDLSTDAANLTVDSQINLQHLGSALTGGDLNGDLHADLIVGSSGNASVRPSVFAFWGGSSLIGTQPLSAANFTLQAPGPDASAFSAKNALATADLNADGKSDMIVGDGLADDGATADTGAVFVIFGSTGLAGVHDLGSTASDYTLYGPTAGAGLQAVAAGKVNGDATVDLVARTADTAHVVLGPISAGARHLGTTPADITITGLAAGGVAVMDLNGDNQDDLILGSGDKIYVLPGPLAAGTYTVGSVTGLITLTGSETGAVFTIGNVAGDTHLDLIIGLPGFKRVFILAGGMSLSGTVAVDDAAVTMLESSFLMNLGYDVTSGDLDHDARPDIIVSTWQQDATMANSLGFLDVGYVYVIYGK
jgi:Bacterial Ig-like domain/Right handed beta helix region/FG-GAP repeat